MGAETDKAAEKHEADKTVTKELKDTFPASDPLASTQPGGGITGTEPPPKGVPARDAKNG